MTDFSMLPPTPESVEDSLPNTCSECSKDLEYTYRVEIPSICSHCLQQIALPNGATALRNTHDMAVFTRPAPPGFKWSFEVQGFVPTDRPRGVPSNPIRGDSPRYTTYYAPGGGGGGGGGERAYTVYPDNPFIVDDKIRVTPGSPNYTSTPATPTYERKPKLDDSPNYIWEYIKRHYPESEIRERYHEIRNELLYPPPVIQADVVDDLTEVSESAILDKQEDPETEESTLSEEVVFSRQEADALMKRAAAAMAQIDRLEKKYSPDLPNGSVIAFRLDFSGTNTYNYAAVKATGKWFATGKIHGAHPAGTGVDWSILLECFERFHASDFQVLREGGDALELETGSSGSELTGRIVINPPGSVMDAFEDPDGDDDDTDDDLSADSETRYGL